MALSIVWVADALLTCIEFTIQSLSTNSLFKLQENIVSYEKHLQFFTHILIISVFLYRSFYRKLAAGRYLVQMWCVLFSE